MVNPLINKLMKKGARLSQNQIKVQQLKNSQFIITLPQMWANILNLHKGSAITFLPGKQGGIEIIKIRKEVRNDQS